MIVEFLAVGFSLFALSRAVLRFREGRMSWGMMLMWSLTWLSIIAFIVYPAAFESISNAIGIQRPLDFMLIFGLILSYYLTFRTYIFLEELKGELAKVVREAALGSDKKRRSSTASSSMCPPDVRRR